MNNLIEILGLDKCLDLLNLALQYGSNATHCHPSSDTFFCDYGEKGFYLYTGPAHIINPGKEWNKDKLVLIQDIRDAVAQHSNIKVFEDFVIAHGGQIHKHQNGEYSFISRMVLAEWVKSPSLAIAKINKFKQTQYSPQATA